MRKLDVVVGAQFGSEAKGHVTQQIIKASSPHDDGLNIRVAGPNAGHTAYDAANRKWPFRQLPVAMVTDTKWMNAIAAGSEVDPDVLLSEIDMVRSVHDRLAGDRLIVDPQATVLTPEHRDAEAKASLTANVGSTGKGIGAARSDRIMRKAGIVGDDKFLIHQLEQRGVRIGEVARLVDDVDHIIIEGTQGYGLGLHAGYYPYCTSSDCRAIDFLAMAGINPWQEWMSDEDFTIWAVARVHPIRVAGNSGPLQNETTWEALGLPAEKTTVTQKIRRVGDWDPDLVRAAVSANGGPVPVVLAITMLDQKFPADAGKDDARALTSEALNWLHQVAHTTRTGIRMVTTSPTTAIRL